MVSYTELPEAKPRVRGLRGAATGVWEAVDEPGAPVIPVGDASLVDVVDHWSKQSGTTQRGSKEGNSSSDPSFTVLDNAVAGWVVQSQTPGSTPLYDHGITGQGEVINVVDTGLDEGSCFFSHQGNAADKVARTSDFLRTDGTGTQQRLYYQSPTNADRSRRKVVQ